jgi:hypothetical protein
MVSRPRQPDRGRAIEVNWIASIEDEKLIHLFSTPVLTYRWPDSATLNRSLKRRITGQAKTQLTEPSLASGGWQSS